MNGKYKSLGELMWRVMKHPLVQDGLTYEDAAEYSIEYLRILGAPMTYIDKVEVLELKDYKVEIPCDLIELRGIRYGDCHGQYNIALRYASDTFHLSEKDNCNNYREYTYIVNKGVIFTSKEHGYIEVAYKAIMTDEEGYPMIPDNEKVNRGLEYYILYRFLEPFYLMGKITDKAFEYITQQYDWYVGAADASLRGINADQMETIMNGINRIIRSNTHHDSSFKNYGNREYLKRYN